jgi:hypothetical protein
MCHKSLITRLGDCVKRKRYKLAEMIVKLTEITEWENEGHFFSRFED